mgnify:CR=1 FL=1
MSYSPDGLSGEIAAPPIPDYLQRVYWWAYLHPRAVFLFEREWLVNLILWGNYQRLCDEALQELAGSDVEDHVARGVDLALDPVRVALGDAGDAHPDGVHAHCVNLPACWSPRPPRARGNSAARGR